MFTSTFNVMLQFALLGLAAAAPLAGEVATSSHGNAWQFGAGGGIIGFIVLVLDIIVFLEVLKSNRPVPHKVLWCVVVFLFPILGLVIYYFFSERSAHMGSGGGYEAIP